MKLDYEYELARSNGGVVNYVISITVYDNGDERRLQCFKEASIIADDYSSYLNMEDLTEKQFYLNKTIDYIIEKNNLTNEESIIPIGLVDFTDKRNYTSSILKIITTNRNKELYKANQILRNIERAIKLKYEGQIFINKFDKYGLNIKTEDKEL